MIHACRHFGRVLALFGSPLFFFPGKHWSLLSHESWLGTLCTCIELNNLIYASRGFKGVVSWGMTEWIPTCTNIQVHSLVHHYWLPQDTPASDFILHLQDNKETLQWKADHQEIYQWNSTAKDIEHLFKIQFWHCFCMSAFATVHLLCVSVVYQR